MAISVVMPALELMQETGKVLAWRKKEGERVVKGEPLLEIETDKAVVEVEAPGEGILAGITAHEGAIIPVGQTIAWLVLPGEAVPAPGAPAAAPSPARAEAARPAAAAAESSAQVAGGGARISPKARRLAREHGIDIAQVRGSGAQGEILASDIQALVDAKGTPTPAAAPAAAGGTEALGIIGRLMAERTTQSWTTVPHFFVVREVDAGALVEAHKKLRETVEQARGVKPTQTDMLVALVARALAKHPRMNASWTGAAIRLNPHVNMALAMAVNDGVVAAVIPKADALDLGEIAVQRRDLSERARAGRSRPADIAGGTFTISNLGMFNVDSFTAIINPPQVAILAVGRIADRVVPVDGKPAIRPVMTLTLSSDHRVVDGARAAAFMNDVVEALRDPEKWLR